ncbi:ribose-phosphate diphosphokinase [Zooshikella ganghwensis]|uniref:ribose-phosphate diphosphokinase n=1 Tax=Zooshikella ganghwensis TaxID=202772 RepID=A0A4P9VS00_9GAMM|nr:ribose-phosphate diphosphokinase [Zooshikella ganghwensis]RDH45579.1 ribose-phosphate diphosphokinase [Zooshikella ganghwensis]
MTSVIVYNFLAPDALFQDCLEVSGCSPGELVLHQFPDGESYVRVMTECKGHAVVVLADLYQPDTKLLPLLFLLSTLKELGASKVGLVLPYLPYMRQDDRFKSGEAITSKTFAKLLSQYADWLITVDPHLHRYHSLDEIYSLETNVVSSAESLAEWIDQQVEKPLLIGPDSESEQWVSSVATAFQLPWQVLSKERFGDRDVQVSAPEVADYTDFTPVLVDDIISTGHTMLSAIQQLTDQGMRKAVCMGVHGVFAPGAEALLQSDLVAQVVTCNTVIHETNHIDIYPLLVNAIALQLSKDND